MNKDDLYKLALGRGAIRLDFKNQAHIKATQSTTPLIFDLPRLVGVRKICDGIVTQIQQMRQFQKIKNDAVVVAGVGIHGALLASAVANKNWMGAIGLDEKDPIPSKNLVAGKKIILISPLIETAETTLKSFHEITKAGGHVVLVIALFKSNLLLAEQRLNGTAGMNDRGEHICLHNPSHQLITIFDAYEITEAMYKHPQKTDEKNADIKKFGATLNPPFEFPKDKTEPQQQKGATASASS